MNIVYFGSSDFSQQVLEKLIAVGRRPLLVVTTADKPAGRSLMVKSTPVKECALKYSLEVITPFFLKDCKTVDRLKELCPDVFIVVSYGRIIPKVLLTIPKLMPLGLHPSLLPAYRGAAPINWVIIKGEDVTGITVFKVNENLDSGEIVLQKKVDIESSDDALSLSLKLICPSVELLLEALEIVERKKIVLKTQDESKVSFAPKLKKDDGRINWSKSVRSIKDLIRGLMGWPGAFTYYKDSTVKILKADVRNCQPAEEPSTIVGLSEDSIDVAAADGVVKIKRLKPQGKTEMTAQAFLCGHRMEIGDKFA